MTNFGLPLHLLRDLHKAFDNLKRRAIQYYRYRQIIANMEARFPVATEEELEASDRICIICRDRMETAKKLPCGHFFHVDCLRSWLQHQQSCPTCRAEIPTTTTNNASNSVSNRNIPTNNVNNVNNNENNNVEVGAQEETLEEQSH